MEELEVEISLGIPFHTFTYVTHDQSSHIIEIDYFATLKDEHQKPTIHLDDHTEMRWISEEEL